MAIDVKLEKFEGPLDLLLHLIEKNKIDIYDIPISEITDQYLEYVQAMDHEDMDVTSEFMVMAATLIDLKCRMLLPKEVNEDGEEEDPRAELMRALLEYKQYKYMAGRLRECMDEAGNLVTRPQSYPREVLAYRPPVDTEELLQGVTMQQLEELFRFVIRRQENKIDPVRSRFGQIEKETVTLPEKMDYVRRITRRRRRVTFRGLLEAENTKMQTIITFLAVLELMKTGNIRITQNELFGDIEIVSSEESAADGTVRQGEDRNGQTK
ncbi:MAG: segregation/condensation protein A [Eubacterium sp.]|nr:segregation/condensation protein A [Eubacterium sp.]